MKKRNKIKTVWCYLDGKKHCDVVQWGLAANKDMDDSKKHFIETYGKLHEVTFKIEPA